MKTLLILASMFISIFSQAKTFTLIDESTKEKFTCTSTAPTPEPGDGNKIEDPDCIAKLTELCKDKGGQSSTACFDLAGRKCKNARGGYVACVKSTQQSCTDSASGSSASCFDRALRECK